MTDELGHPASGYFSLTTNLPVGLIITNPRTGGPRTITIQFDSGRLTGEFNLVSYVTILYGSEKWAFDFKSLNLNVADRNAFRIPANSDRVVETKVNSKPSVPQPS